MSVPAATSSCVVISCEHAGHDVPVRWAASFAGARATLESHRGWDRGALDVARVVARRLDAPLLHTTVTRLLVDTNRSPDAPDAFSELTRGLGPLDRQRIVAEHHRPHRDAVRAAVVERIDAGGSAVHVSVHSFVPELDGVARDADVGLLYDPARERERATCGRIEAALVRIAPSLRVRHNYPYLGTSDGLTTTLRAELGEAYVGLEVELNQRLVDSGPNTRQIAGIVAGALASASR